ncbi:MAG TPA: hypothetical protein DCY04_09880 [Eubacterium sp.]|uniref:hypothetical protein n=1 Tax=Agathobacter rectalis TaxID=39491 RepID=UPI000E8E808F|nr:hypothetical protein [Agathobacter rectalis]HAX67504.1 hypothetical protein [Eubacterium sp.]
MEWIVTNGNGIVCSKDELAARREFIGMITGVSPSRWHIIVKDINNRFYYKCNTIDDINGLFITGHVGEVWEICKSPGIGKFDFVVANTCIWEEGYEKQILSELMYARQDIILWYAKQVVSLESGLALRKTNELENKGMFGFPTSKSERILFKNRKKGFMNALKVAFDKVSAIYIA